MYNKRKDYKTVQAANQPLSRESGVTSIFIVVFFSLLISVITLSFIGIVIRGSTESTNSDLSHSAYDSAEAGIEDAKRAIALETSECNANGASCATYQSNLAKQDCTALPSFASSLGLRTVAGSSNEIQVQDSSNDTLAQSYTCVNVTMNTADYVNSESQYQSDIIPLKSTSAFTGITLNWFTHSDAGSADTVAFTPRTTAVTMLPPQANWDQTASKPYTPALLRVQLISYSGGSITDASLASSSKTLFLYPTATGVTSLNFDQDVTPAASATGAPIFGVKCSGTQYACSVNLALGSNAGKTSFLRVTPVYKKSTFQVQLTGSSNPLFAGVQPMVDSTGRANDLFRRIQARVRLENQILYPEYAVDDSNSFCKNFSVGADPADFVPRC